METSNFGPGPIGDLAATSLEASRQIEQVGLDALKTAKERNRLGQFATPPALALDIANYMHRLWSGRTDRVRFLDPSIGTGSFYSALCQAFPRDRIEAAAGFEIDPAFAKAAAEVWADTGLQVVEGDFTKQRPAGRFNLILANPPYVRHHHLDKLDKERLKSLVADGHRIDISGLAGLYCHFLLLSDSWMEDNGLAAWLIPSEFMDVNYGVAVKTYLTERVKLLHIHRSSPADAQFGDALVTSAIVVFEKVPPPSDHQVRMSLGGSISAPSTSEMVPLPTLRAGKKWKSLPRGGANDTRHESTLGDFFTIKRGIATGANSFFILPRREAIRHEIPDEFLRPILPSSRHLGGGIIEAAADGYPKLDRALVLIDCHSPEAVVRARFPKFWAYLEAGKRRGIHEGYLASRRIPWYSQERREAAPFLCTYMGRLGTSGNPFKFYLNRSRATAANVYLLLYPKGALAKCPELYPAVLAGLQGIKADHLIGEGRVYGGGLHKLEPKELACLSAAPIVELLGRPSVPRQMELAYDEFQGGGRFRLGVTPGTTARLVGDDQSSAV